MNSKINDKFSGENGAFFANILAPHEINFDDFHENRSPGLVAPWIIRRRDIFNISRFFQEAGASYILDINCTNGFIGWLLAMEGIPVTGVSQSGDTEISVFRHSLFAQVKSDINRIENSGIFDGAVLSWSNNSPDVLQAVKNLNLRGLVYVMETSTGTTSDKSTRFIKDLLEIYKPVMYWDNVCHKDINSTLFRIVAGSGSGALAPEIFKTSHNRVILFLHRELHRGKVIENLKKTEKREIKDYPWEKELDRYYRVGECVDGNRKILWRLKPITSESEFLRTLSYGGIMERGLVI
jgi:hypothetical protein